MKRREFVTAAAAAAATAATPFAAWAAAVGTRTTQEAIFAALPPPREGQWVRLIMGSGTAYQKQIGLGVERGGSEDLLFVETQIGMPGGECNPNTLKKVYLREKRFGSLFTAYAVVANVAKSGNTITRWADVADGQPRAARDATLRLLDAAYLYDPRPCTVRSVASATAKVGHTPCACTHVVADFAHASGDGPALERMDLWHTAAVPFSTARYRAAVRGMDPFEVTLFSYGSNFKPELPVSLETLREMTPGGVSTQTS